MLFRRIWILLSVAAIVALLGMKIFSPSASAPKPAIPALIQALDTHSVVALGEGHWDQRAGDFYLSLARSPGFADQVNAVVLECANSRYQSTLDRYMNGEDVPFDQLSQVWRNTTKVVSWDSPIYENLIRGLREVNVSLPPARRFRVLAGDSPIDWTQVRTRAEWESAQQGEGFFASLIEREVLDKKGKALVIMGANHVTHGRNWFGHDDVTSLLEKDHHPVYVALLWGIKGDDDPAVRSSQPPSLTELKDTRLGDTKFYGREAQEVADAYLYLGGSEQIAFPNWADLQKDKAYWAELQRRHQIQFGCALDIERWNQRGKPCP